MNVKPHDYTTDNKTISNAIKRLQKGKDPRKGHIIGYWYKSLSFYKQNLNKLMNVFIEGQQLLTWLSLTKTKLIPKNDITSMAKDYRPIVCQYIMYKIYTGCINIHLQDHC